MTETVTEKAKPRPIEIGEVVTVTYIDDKDTFKVMVVKKNDLSAALKNSTEGGTTIVSDESPLGKVLLRNVPGTETVLYRPDEEIKIRIGERSSTEKIQQQI